jgi:membrane protease YdiL (CAAX protease family)
MSDKLVLAQLIEAVIILPGLVLLWTQGFSPAARARSRLPQPLPAWDIPGYLFALSVIRVLGVALIFQFFVMAVMKQYATATPLTEGIGYIIVGSSLHVGALLGLVVGWYFLKSNRLLAHMTAAANPAPALPPALSRSQVALAGAKTFAIIVAALAPLTIVWPWLLQKFGYEPLPQQAVKFFSTATPIHQIVFMTLLAVVIAPAAEELVFRKGLFRYLRGRVLRIFAFTIPAFLFAFAHEGLAPVLPLFVFALIQSIAYERTGRIAVLIVAHALYNLHTAAFLLAGIDPYETVRIWLFR